MTAHTPSRHAVTFIFITVFLDMVGFGLIMPVLPRLIEDVSGADLAGASLLAGWLFFAYGGMQFLCGPLLGNLSDAYGRRPILLLSVFGLGVDYLLTAFAPNMFWLFVGRTLAGLCGASYTTANAYLADITEPESRAKVFGYMGAAFGLGFIIGPAIGGILGEYGPRVPFFAAAGISILNFAYGYFVLPETLPRESRRPFSLARSNPIGVFKVFATYRQALPLCIVMAMYFFATSVYPAIWAFWGIARFNWSEMTIGWTLSVFGLITAVVQGGLTGPAVKWLGERNTTILALATSVIAAAGYGVATDMSMVLILFLVHAPEGFAQPALTALMSKDAPPDAQGELQGGIASAQNLALLVGTVMFAQIFGYFLQDGSPIQSPNVAYYISAGLGLLALSVFIHVTRRRSA
ncbi:MAG: TCR/Tet family MFS transporter [Hyphomicrobiales bacterium]|nr:TCR/Tet family MFS transporter [Hyphomicrobiales bacterium]